MSNNKCSITGRELDGHFCILCTIYNFIIGSVEEERDFKKKGKSIYKVGQKKTSFSGCCNTFSKIKLHFSKA